MTSTTRPLRVAILTSGRFHVCDLARELDALGHEVAFYSLLPAWRTRRFGLPDRCNRWLGPLVAPVYAARKLARRTRFESLSQHALSVALDEVAARVIGPCDVFIGMSSLCLSSLAAMRRRHGAHVLVERGSRHILSQKEILESMPRPPGAPPPVAEWTVRRELAEYERADTIVVPSIHAEESFVERGVPRAKLFRNPYGVDLSMFPPTPVPAGEATILMVGNWSLQKGCDLLVDAWRRLGRGRLVHVGAIIDAPVPSDAGFEHYEPVPQPRLVEFYRRAHVLALASRQDGFGMVQSQALACGLRVVCSDRTGGEDLVRMVSEPSAITVTPVGDVDALAHALGEALDAAVNESGLRDRVGDAREAFSWQGYARRYERMLRERAGQPPPGPEKSGRDR